MACTHIGTLHDVTPFQPGQADLGSQPFGHHPQQSKRSAIITFVQTATKSRTKRRCPSADA